MVSLAHLAAQCLLSSATEEIMLQGHLMPVLALICVSADHAVAVNQDVSGDFLCEGTALSLTS